MPNHINQNTDDYHDGITDEHARIIEISDTIMTFLNNRKYESNYRIMI